MKMTCMPGRSGGSSERRTAIMPGRSHRTSSIRMLPPRDRTRNGAWTSPIREGWLYLAVLIDLFSRKIVGWAAGDRLHRDLALAALRKALTTRRPREGLIHHSDRGSQYCSF